MSNLLTHLNKISGNPEDLEESIAIRREIKLRPH
jgi:hypothetical protein